MLAFEKVTPGDELPELRLELTATHIVTAAIASRDYEPVHHDPQVARARGTRDIFVNILTSNGFAIRYVTDWAGPEAVVKRAAIRLGVPHYPNDTLVLSGQVTATEDLGDEGRVEVSVRGCNALGDHLTGTIVITLPKEES